MLLPLDAWQAASSWPPLASSQLGSQRALPFARVYAVYGDVFIVLSYLWGWALDGERPDVGDCVGAAVALGGFAEVMRR